MKYKKIMFMLVLAIFIFGAASVCASDVNDTVIASEDTSQLELSAGSELDADNLKTSETNTILTQTNNDESMSGEIDSEVLGADIGTYSGLSEEIGSGGNIELIHDYYTYDSGSTIEISDDNSVIDGKGAVIDMAGSNKQAFDVSASGVIIKNLTIKNAKYNALGGAILFGRSGTVENCNFTNNSGTSSGGAVYFSNTGTVTNCTFVGNTASIDGGAVYFSNTGIVTNCNFINNKATGTAGEMGSSGDGGAVHFTGDGTVTNCNFTGNTASGDDGGAVHFTGDGTVSNCTFVGNTAGRSGGGAVYFSDAGIVTNCNFTNNKATGGSIYGGAIWIYSGTVTNCSFTNHSANYGGAVRMGSGSVENCNFTDNTATRDGGAIWIYSGTVTNCNFTNSSATGAGGAVYFYDNSEVTNCNFIYNVAKSSTLGGGAIFFMISGNVAKCNFTDNSASFGGAVLFGGKGNISNSNFTNNSASNGGGAINMASGSVENCNFTDNKATSSSGGSIWFTGNGDVINCIFTNNSATGDGGAVYFYEGATGRIINCNFTDNIATSYGGAVYFNETGTVSNCTFVGNTASELGGAIKFSGTGTVTNCNFTNNTAMYGGAINMDSGSVSNCTFVGNTASGDGGAIWMYSGSVENCNFTNNTASQRSGAVFFLKNGEVTNCNFINNTATFDGAVRMYSGSVENCNFINNVATRGEGGAIYFAVNNGAVTNCTFVNNSALITGGAIFMISGSVSNCNFTGNTATRYGGAVYFYDEGSVSNCNFTGNNATTGSAIYLYKGDSSDTLTVSNSTFLNNRANAESLDVVKNDNNITITFTGQNNLLNAIYSREDAEVAFYNVTYWGANGITTVSSTMSGSNKAAGQKITVGVVVNNELVLSDVMVTDENGMIVLDISAGENYYISARHDTDSYYTEAETTISNNTKFNVNVTSQKTTNKTINITAESNIPNDVVKGKLLFILPNGTQIDAIYGANGTWWAEHTFDDYGEYNVNASYVGLDNVTVNNGTITINKVNSTIALDNIVLDYGESANVTVTTTGATGITAKIDGNDVAVINNYTIQISGLKAGNHTLTVTTIPDNDHNPVTASSKITVNKVESTLTVDDIVFDYEGEGSGDMSFTGASEVNANVVNQPKAVVSVSGNKITVSGLAAGTYTLNVTTVPDENHTAVTETATITVNKVNSTLTLDDVELDYGDSKNVTVATEGATGITAKIDGVNVTVSNYTIPISGLGAGNYTLTVTTIPDKNHNPVTATSKITVNKVESTLTVDDIVFDYGNESSGDVSFTGASQVIANVVNQPSAVVSVSGNKISVSGLAAGTYTLNVTTVPDENHTAVTETATITVNKVNSTLTLDDVELDYGETKNITVTAEGATGITAKIDGVNVTVNSYTIPISGLSAGNYKLTVTTIPDNNHNPITKQSTITVNKLSTEITLANETLDLKVNDEFAVLADLTPDGAGNPKYSSSNESVVKVSDEGLITALGNGTSTVTVSFAGNDNYTAAQNKTIAVTVTLNDASVSAEDITLDVGANATIDAVSVPDGLDVTYVPDNSGVVTIENGVVTAVKEGTAKITLTVGGDGVYALNSTIITVTVNKIDTSIDVDQSSLNLEVGDDSSISATLTPADAGNVTFTSSDNKVVTVDDKGNVKAVGEGKANIIVSFAGDDKYNAAENKTVAVTVSLKDASVSAEDITLDVGANAIVDVTVVPDGLDVTYVPDNSGVVTIENGVVTAVKEGTATVTLTVGGDGVYALNSTTITVTVNKLNATADVSLPENINVGDNSTVNVVLPNDATGNVTVKVDGEVVDTVTVKDGSADVTIPSMSAGKHTVEIDYTGDGKYNPVNENKVITVSKKNTTPEITIPSDIEYGDNATVDVKLPSDAKGNVTLNVDGEVIDTVPVEKGTASVKLPNLNAGNHTAVITYSGDDKYEEAQISSNITVKDNGGKDKNHTDNGNENHSQNTGIKTVGNPILALLLSLMIIGSISVRRFKK